MKYQIDVVDGDGMGESFFVTADTKSDALKKLRQKDFLALKMIREARRTGGRVDVIPIKNLGKKYKGD